MTMVLFLMVSGGRCYRTTPAGAGINLGGMKYADAVTKGYLKPIPAYAYYENLTQWSSGIREVSIFENSWVALRQVSIGYTVPMKSFRKVPINNLRISLTGTKSDFTCIKTPKTA